MSQAHLLLMVAVIALRLVRIIVVEVEVVLAIVIAHANSYADHRKASEWSRRELAITRVNARIRHSLIRQCTSNLRSSTGRLAGPVCRPAEGCEVQS